MRTWTVNRAVDAGLLRVLGISAVITDVPAAIKRGLASPTLATTPA